MTADHSSSELHFHHTVYGRGPTPVVLIHGMGRSSEYWYGIEECFPKQSFKVLTFDTRGIGKTPINLDWKTPIETLAKDVIQLMDRLKIESAHIVGLSLGGMVAMALGLEHGERIRSLQLINSSVGGHWYPRISPKAMAAMARVNQSLAQLNEQIVDLVSGRRMTRERRQEILNIWNGIGEKRGRLSNTVARQILAAGRFQVFRRLRNLAVPVNILVGTADRFVPPGNSYLLHHAIPQSRLSVFKDGGHELMVDHADELMEVLLTFVEEVEHRRQSSL